MSDNILILAHNRLLLEQKSLNFLRNLDLITKMGHYLKLVLFFFLLLPFALCLLPFNFTRMTPNPLSHPPQNWGG